MGAIGAHAVAAPDAETAQRLRGWIEVASTFQLFHALALLAVALIARFGSSQALVFGGLAFAVGSLCFSGGLYLQAFAGMTLGPVIPLGGTLFILGWLALAWHGLRALPDADKNRR